VNNNLWELCLLVEARVFSCLCASKTCMHVTFEETEKRLCVLCNVYVKFKMSKDKLLDYKLYLNVEITPEKSPAGVRCPPQV
jgi:hypothetical protein